MKKSICFLILFIAMCQYGREAWGESKSFNAGIREPIRAGQFYSADPAKLRRAINAYLDDAIAPAGEKPTAIIVPHAGYIYSGQIAADAYKQAAGHQYDLVVLLGTNHVSRFSGATIYPDGGYRTPLGIAKIDEDISAKLLSAGEDFTYKDFIHKREHSIEVQIPFVQTLFPKTKIVAAIVGNSDLDLCIRFGKILADTLRGKNALIVASTDLSHYPAYDDAVKSDRKVLDAVLTMEPQAVKATIQKQMKENIPGLSTCACGEEAILTAMIAAKALGATCSRIISYANSGDAAIGGHHRVVGYGAVSFVKNLSCQNENPGKKKQSSHHEAVLNDKHKSDLISFARKTIQQILTADITPLARGFDPVLNRKQGAFVTLKKHGELRGCIGHMAEDLPLCQAVGAMAVQAAFNDRRFHQVRLKELSEIEIEISVLTPYKLVGGADDIVIGRDGVKITKDSRSAVFLPQVAPEQGWNRDQMLDHLCRKAGLSPGSWKEGAQLYTFQALVFKESDLK